jgi:hypothetical protein
MVRNPTYIGYIQACGWMGLNELDGKIVSVKPGDHIVYKAWIWTDASTVGGGGGCYMAVDAYGASGRICELRGSGGIPQYATPRLIVPWGSGAWVQLTMDFYIQPTYKADGYLTRGTIVPTGIIPWFQSLNYKYYTEGAAVYIYGAELYVNP